MSRSALTTWNQRVQKRLARATGKAPLSPTALDAVIADAARQLRLDPVVLLGALAARPFPIALWSEVLRGLVPLPSLRQEDWSALAAAAEAVAAAFSTQVLTCWVVEPSQPADVYVLASCLAAHAAVARLEVVATHSDPRLVELGRSGLVPEGTVACAPDEVQLYFRPLGRCWQAAPELRAAVRFEAVSPSDLPGMQCPEDAGAFSLVVSRGQLVQLDRGVARRVAQRLSRSMREHGFLLVGPGDHDDRIFQGELEPHVAPGVLLYQKAQALHVNGDSGGDFAALLAAVEAEPIAFEPRWQLARLLLREGYAESAVAHLRELARWRPEFPGVWQNLAKAYILAGNTTAAEAATSRARLVAASSEAPQLMM